MKIQYNRQQTKAEKILNFILPVAVPIVLILLWEVAARMEAINTVLLPAPSTLWSLFKSNVISGKIGKNLGISFIRVIMGFLLGGGIGLLFGFALGLVKPLNRALSLLLSVLRPIPTVALVPVFILVFGIGEESKYAVIAVGSFWPIMLNTIGGIVNVDQKLLEVSYTYRLGNIKTIFGVVLPAAVPTILTGVRLGISSAWMSVVAAEMIASSKGIGYLIMYSREMAQVGAVYVYVLIIGVIGFALDKVLLQAEKAILSRTRGFK